MKKLILLAILFNAAIVFAQNSTNPETVKVITIEKDSTVPETKFETYEAVLQNGKSKGILTVSEMKSQRGLYVKGLESGTFKAMKGVCQVTYFTLKIEKSNSEVITYQNRSNIFDDKTKLYLSKVKSGDKVSFIEVAGRCIGDKSDRAMNTLEFSIN